MLKKIIAAIIFLAAAVSSGALRADELFWRLIAPPKFHEEIIFHKPVLDGQGKLLPWTDYDHLIRLAMGFIEDCPRDKVTGLPWYEQYCDFRYENMEPDRWPHNPAGLYGMMVETVTRYYGYTGERKWIELARHPLDHLIAESTPQNYAWPGVPYASADNSGVYRGGSKEKIDGIETDKVGQAAVGYLRFYKLTGEKKYLAEAVHCADVLAAKIRPGGSTHSPWPFRLNARNGKILEEYTSDVLWPIVLFDELIAMGMDKTGSYKKARATAWGWLFKYPMKNHRWKGYFEDVVRDPANLNRDQYTPGEVARYLMRHPELDPNWKKDVPALLAWIKKTLGDDRKKWLGATAIREQRFCMQLASSHTARYASLNAMWYALSGEASYQEEALRSFAFASYLAREDGIVAFSLVDQDVWFSDGYFDYVPHFIDGMAALPELAPKDQDHLLSSTSIITRIAYLPGKISYQAFDPEGVEILRLSFAPSRVSATAGTAEYSFDPVLKVLRVQRRGSKEILIQ